jgi:hypothetical protein
LYDKEEMMNQNLKQFIYGAILLGGGLYLGRMIGTAEAYKETSGIIASQMFDGASTNLKLHLNLLKLIEADEIQKTSGKLDNLVDLDLMALAQYSEVPKNHRSPEILKSIEEAKEYRQKHPKKYDDKGVSDTIKKAMDLVK